MKMRFLAASLITAALACAVFAQEPAAQPAAAEQPAATPPAAEQPAAEQPSSDHAPKIACDEPSFDFGTIAPQEFIEHDYIMRNDGDLTLEIQNARPSCGCTVANISEKVVPPGGVSKITARLSLTGRTGQQHKIITVDSNDPKQPQLTLTLMGTVEQILSVRPDRLMLGQISEDTMITGTVEIAATDPTPFDVTGVESFSSNIVATFETVEEGKLYRVHVATLAPMSPGLINGNVQVKTSHPRRPTIDIPVTVSIVAGLLVAPPEIMLTDVDGQSVTRYVVVRAGGNQSLAIESVEPPDPSIKVQVLPFGDNGFRIQLDNITVSKDLDGKMLKIVTNVESMKEINVPFRIVTTQPPPPA